MSVGKIIAKLRRKAGYTQKTLPMRCISPIKQFPNKNGGSAENYL